MSRRLLAFLAGLIAIASIAAVPTIESSSSADVSAHPVQGFDALDFLGNRAALTRYLNKLQVNRYLRAVATARAMPRGHGGGCAAGDWECFKRCTLNTESHTNYGDTSANGTYRGGYQYSQAFWDGQATASGRPDLIGVDPAQASPSDQDYIAHYTYSTRGKAPWGGRC